ncbi:hypothetical protein [Geoalkalibacter sp.]|uniref:hypothetical protein n=1 Tax=Geoalkalibacter sp. TaxID=3041440 RepID=UPI00272DEAC3|nr:hypothetical protein [Geoalkalibacter sp.]
MSVFRTGISLPTDVVEIIERHRRAAEGQGYKFTLSAYVADLIRERERFLAEAALRPGANDRPLGAQIATNAIEKEGEGSWRGN